MIYTVKDILGRQTTGKWKFTKTILTDGQNNYNVTIFNPDVQVGYKIDGELGDYNQKYDNYKFKTNKIIPSGGETIAPAGKITTEDKRQSNIAFESFYASSCNLLQKSGDIGEAIAVTWQLHTYLTTGEWILMCSAEQRKNIVAKLGSVDIARGIIYDKYHKPYLHLLTEKEAQEVLANA